MCPDSFWRAMKSRFHPGDPAAPKFLYINPTGANPCGTVLPIQRKRLIYDICCEYDMVIVEDDPYYYMQFAREDGSKEREPSFMSIDNECRVIRSVGRDK